MLHVHRTTENKNQQEQTNFYAQSVKEHIFSLVTLSINMKIALFVLLSFPFLVFGQVKNKPKTQPKEPPHEELRKALYEGRYNDALKYISQGADILKTDTLERVWTPKELERELTPKEIAAGFDRRKTILKERYETPRVGAFLGMILPPVAVLEGQARGRKYYIDDYHIIDVVLERTLADSLKSPERLKVIEYLLQKGANPNGGFENYPLFVAVRNKDLQAVELLFRYKADANVTVKYPKLVHKQSVFDETLIAYRLGVFISDIGIKEKKIDSACRKEFWQMTHLLLKNGLSAGKNIGTTIYDEEVFDYFLSIADTKDVEQSYIPVFQLAYEDYQIEVIKKLKAKGFTFEGEKGSIVADIIRLKSINNPEFMKTLDYLISIGASVNIEGEIRTSKPLCAAIGIRDLVLIKKLLSLGARPYHRYCLGTNDKVINQYFDKQAYLDYEQSYILAQPKEKQKALKKELKEIIKFNKTGKY